MTSTTNNVETADPSPGRLVSAMPEVLTRRDVENPPSWTVERGLPMRGDAWTNRTRSVMRVPFGTDATSRTVRAHEMAHAKVSPSDPDAVASAYNLPTSTIRMAEEYRVNLLVGLAGFDLDALVDGSERTLGARLALAKDWPNLVRSLVAVARTKGAKDMVAGVKSVDVELATKCRKVLASLEQHLDEWTRESVGRSAKKRRLDLARPRIANTEPLFLDVESGNVRSVLDYDRVAHEWRTVPRRETEVEVPAGFDGFTVPLARFVERLIDPRSQSGENVAEGDGEIPSDDDLDSVAPTGQTPGEWARLVFDRSIALNGHARNMIGRKRFATPTGIVPRRVERLLTDPERRIFTREQRSTGGVVLIDQSGSMRLSLDDVNALVEASAGCVVIGYSHGRRPTEPNIWTLADRGRVATRMRSGNGGNGCDRPAFDYALTVRRKGEPVIWVTDGYVTYAQDGWASKADRLALLADVRRHGVSMVADVATAIELLRRSNVERPRASYTRGLVEDIDDATIATVWGGN